MMAGLRSCKYKGCADVILDNMQKKLMQEESKQEMLGLGFDLLCILPSFVAASFR